MFSSNKKACTPKNLFINVLIFGTLLSGIAQLIHDNLFSDANKLTMYDDNRRVAIVVNINNETTAACGELGCFKMKNISFTLDTNRSNITKEFGDNITLECPLSSGNDNMIYWIGARKANVTKNDTHFSVTEGYFYKGDSHNRSQLSFAKLTGYQQRYFVCILVNNNSAKISYQYLTVEHDEDESHYSGEEFNEDDRKNAAIIHKAKEAQKNQQLAGIIAAAVVLLLTIIIIIGITVYRRRNGNVIVKYWLKKVTVEKPPSEAGEVVMPIVKIEKQRLTQVGIIGNDTTLMSEYQMPVDAQWEIPRSKISLTGQLLGEGEFGKVLKAESHGVVSEDAKTIVAVKMLKDGYTDADMISLVSEMEIMKMIGKHENIINLLGCCTQDGPLYVVVEYARNGSLRDYLKKHKPPKNAGSTENLLSKPLAQRELAGFVWQVAKGMEYLASRGCIHRDLAARNVLVSADLVLKIADFGLARDVRDTDYYRKRTAGKLPMKWMAPESIAKNYYDKRSDVWSFGVITWEIMTFGEIPYAKISVYKLYNHLESNNRLEKPDDCSNEMYDMMKSCWAFKPEDRPTFEEIVGIMKSMLNLPENEPPPENMNEYVTMLA
ncbi:fibroblast growth factor receptor homolog 1-like [Cydia pomonella]|uniref:fibroblast growth factor receptor homolog 1-like n=1 Tax=Cydia pomonella TaxID=82600 RepID=UPI002ADE3E11|nr:fibroblast growth factor receptor homolog 1-like [Cydia pomonella]